MVTETLKRRIAFKFGKPILYSKDCDILAFVINKHKPNSVSATTLKRFFGMASSQTVPRKYTLDALAQYAGFNDWDTIRYGNKQIDYNENKKYDTVFTVKLRQNKIVTVVFNSKEKIRFQSLGNHYLQIIESDLDGFNASDTVKIFVLEVKNPLICETLVRKQRNIFATFSDDNTLISDIFIDDINNFDIKIPGDDLFTYSTNAHRIVTWASTPFISLLKYNENEIIGKPIEQFMSFQTRIGVQERAVRLEEGETINDLLAGFINKDGGLVELFGRIIPKFDCGIYEGVQAIFKKTDSKFIEDKLVENKIKLSDKRRPSLLILGFDWTVIYVDESQTTQLTCEERGLIGKKIIDLLPSFVNSEVYTKYKLCLEKRIRIEFSETYTFENGVTKIYSIIAEPINEGMVALVTNLSA